MKLKAIVWLNLLLMVTLAVSAFAQTASEKKEAGTPIAQSDPFAGMKAVIFEIKNKNADQVADVVRGLTSARGQITSNNGMRTVTVRDYPEKLATIEAAINRLD